MQLPASLKPYWAQLTLFATFLAFGLTIALVSFFLSNYLQTKSLQQELDSSARKELLFKQELFISYLERAEQALRGGRHCNLFIDYLDNRAEALRRERAESCLLAVSNALSKITQLRYIDETGMERIRIDRRADDQWSYPIASDALQDKSQRYYTHALQQLAAHATWYSPLDLNMEHGKLVLPYQPTVRIAQPIYHHGRYRGFIIINIEMQPILEQLIQSRLFDVLLSDHQGQLLVRNQAGTSQLKHLWAGTDEKPETLADHWPGYAEQALQHSALFSNGLYFSLQLTGSKPHQPQLILSLTSRSGVLEQLQKEEQKYLLLVTLSIVLCSLLLGLSFSGLLSNLYQKLLDTREALVNQLELVNRYIPITQTDNNGRIKSANRAYHQLVGFLPEELFGRNHNILRHPDTPDSLYQELWGTLHEGREWYGEIQDKRKDGSSVWLALRITPDYDDNQQLTGYTAISENISDRKQLEYQALTDPMTGLYNRRHFDEICGRELNRCIREQLTLGLALLDTDCFKQYNDTFGHEAGDRLLIQIGECMQQQLHRATDFAFRIGGDEFAILFSALNADQGWRILEQVRKSMAHLKIQHPGNKGIGIASLSIGCALILPSRNDTQVDLFQAADEALYQAKDAGRNRVCLNDMTQPSDPDNS